MSESPLKRITQRITHNLSRDTLVQNITNSLRNKLQADRVVLYYFYTHWEGQVTFEALSDSSLSILGSKGADECFNDEYAALYEEGRIRAIDNIEKDNIHQCHRDFLASIKVKSNLAVPILNVNGLWGLLISHYCNDYHIWQSSEIELMKKAASQLAQVSTIARLSDL